MEIEDKGVLVVMKQAPLPWILCSSSSFCAKIEIKTFLKCLNYILAAISTPKPRDK